MDIFKSLTSLQALIQSGLHYTKDIYDKERYEIMSKIVTNMLASATNIEEKLLLELFSAEQGYATPKIDVRAGVFKDNKILLVKEKEDNLWSVPGGWADVNLSAAECAVKEVREESGLETEVIKLVAVLDRQKHSHPPHLFHIYKILFLCNITGGAISPGLETNEVKFFALDNLPPLSKCRILKEQIELLAKHHKNLSLPTEYE